MESKIRPLLDRFLAVEQLLSLPETIKDQTRYRQLSREHAHLRRIHDAWKKEQQLRQQLLENQQLAAQGDPELQPLIKEEQQRLQAAQQALLRQLDDLLLPADPHDDRSLLLELRAGTGGEEAALFVADCVRMYTLYAAHKGWKWESLSATPAPLGGYKEYIMQIAGRQAYRLLRFEGGTHRVQRVPQTETQGRVHTSTITVAVLLEPTAGETLLLDESKELRIDTYRASGAGGQHVNTTDSAVRITHLASGLVVHCQQERSQHKNKEKALRLLKAKLLAAQQQQQKAASDRARALQVGSGERCERIRTYNFLQNRLTDHRIQLTLYHLDRLLAGEIEAVTQALVRAFYGPKCPG